MTTPQQLAGTHVIACTVAMVSTIAAAAAGENGYQLSTHALALQQWAGVRSQEASPLTADAGSSNNTPLERRAAASHQPCRSDTRGGFAVTAETPDLTDPFNVHPVQAEIIDAHLTGTDIAGSAIVTSSSDRERLALPSVVPGVFQGLAKLLLTQRQPMQNNRFIGLTAYQTRSPAPSSCSRTWLRRLQS